MKAKTAKTIILIIGVAILFVGLAMFIFVELYWLKPLFLVLLGLMGVV